MWAVTGPRIKVRADASAPQAALMAWPVCAQSRTGRGSQGAEGQTAGCVSFTPLSHLYWVGSALFSFTVSETLSHRRIFS